VVEERAHLDYGLDDRPLDEVADLPNDDYLTIERIEEHEHPAPDSVPLSTDGSDGDGVDDSGAADEGDATSTYGAP